MQSDKVAASIYQQFEDYRTFNKNSGFRVVPSLVDTVVASWNEDLIRFERWHGSENSELHKAAAFLVFWFSKIKPIHIAHYHKHSKQISINESFGFALALKMLDVKNDRISEDFFAEFVYSLYFRSPSPRQMFFTFQMLDRLNQDVPASQRQILI